MSTTYFNTLKPQNTFLKFAWAKFMRLMVPFFVAIPVVLVPRLYFAQDYQSMCCVHWSGAPYASKCIPETNIFIYAWKTIPTID